MSKEIKIRVNGSTANLGGGFDALGLAVVLPLEVTFHLNNNSSQKIVVKGEGAEQISGEKNNIILRSFERVCKEVENQMPDIALEINNPIPLKRGLGSSGAAIVAGLLAGNVFCDNKLSQQQLLNLANEVEGHPENASASLLGGLTVNGIQEGHVLCEQIEPPKSWVGVCYVPDLEISTEDARKVLPTSVTRAQAVRNVQSVAMMVTAFTKQRPELLQFATGDFLHQPYRKKLIKGYDDITSAAIKATAHCVFISGSGSTIMTISARENAKNVSDAMRQAAQSQQVAGRAMILEFAHSGAEILKD